eukprot:1529000-Alexandrium_andersonii.AAC.1
MQRRTKIELSVLQSPAQMGGGAPPLGPTPSLFRGAANPPIPNEAPPERDLCPVSNSPER